MSGKISRAFSRVMFEAKGVVATGSTALEGTVENLSMGGMFFRTDQAERIAVGEEVVASITVEGGHSLLNLRLKSKVVRQEEGGLAVQFSVSKAELDALMLLKTVIISNGGDRQRIQREFQAILMREEDRLQKAVSPSG